MRHLAVTFFITRRYCLMAFVYSEQPSATVRRSSAQVQKCKLLANFQLKSLPMFHRLNRYRRVMHQLNWFLTLSVTYNLKRMASRLTVLGLIVGIIVAFGAMQTTPAHAFGGGAQFGSALSGATRPPLVVQSRRNVRERNPVRPAPRAEVETVIRPAKGTSLVYSPSASLVVPSNSSSVPHDSSVDGATTDAGSVTTSESSSSTAGYRGPLVVRERE
jgi:hypothetical protein